MSEAVVAFVSVLVGVAFGAWLTRRNEKRATTDRLLVEVLNEIIGGIAEVANGVPGAQVRYGTAMSQLALHGSPAVVEAFRRLQDRGEKVTQEGRDLLVGALMAARSELDHGEISTENAWVLLFGSPTQWRGSSGHPSAEDDAKRRPAGAGGEAALDVSKETSHRSALLTHPRQITISARLRVAQTPHRSRSDRLTLRTRPVSGSLLVTVSVAAWPACHRATRA